MEQQRLRIALVVHAYNKRMGHSRYVVELAERFVRQGHEVHVFTNEVDEPRSAGVCFHHVPALRWKALTTILSFILPATLLVRGRFDVIHAQGLCGLRQTVTTAHICTQGWLDASRRIHGKWTFAQMVTRTLVVPLERLTFLTCFSPRVIAISEANRRDLARYYGRTKDVEVVYHGIDLERFHPSQRAKHRVPVREQLGLQESDLAALYVGDMKKGVIPAIRAAAAIPGLHLVIVSPSLAAPYLALVRELDVERRIHFCPESSTVERYYAAADLFLFPTFHDAFGLVILEAMACGLSVITSRAAGAAEIIDHLVDGCLVDDPWDVGELTAALARLVGDAEMRARLGEEARRTAEQFTWDLAAERTLDVYHRVCRRERSYCP